MGLSTDERSKVLNRKREMHQTGRVMDALSIQRALDADEMPDPSLMADDGVKTDVPLLGGVNIEIPPRHGKGSGKPTWVEFAARVSDIDSEVISRMTRDDIIATLEARGNIPEE
jgi:hypothetical protein